jgi:hypothetical protein
MPAGLKPAEWQKVKISPFSLECPEGIDALGIAAFSLSIRVMLAREKFGALGVFALV